MPRRRKRPACSRAVSSHTSTAGIQRKRFKISVNGTARGAIAANGAVDALTEIAQPELRKGSSWRATIVEQAAELALLFEDSPSLRRTGTDELPKLYRRAMRLAMRETGLEIEAFPKECPYSLKQLSSGELPQ